MMTGPVLVAAVFLSAALLPISHCALPDGFNTTVCTPNNDNGGRLFPSLPNDFYTKVEWTDMISRQSFYIEQWFSKTNNLATMLVTGLFAPGKTSQFITNAATGEYFTIFDTERINDEMDNCMREELSKKAEFAFPFQKDSTVKNGAVLLNGTSTLLLGAALVGPLAYTGNNRSWNGMPVDTWSGCLFVDDGKVTLNVHYFFARNDSDMKWITAGGFLGAPVGLWVRGGSSDGSATVEQMFNYVYFSTQWPISNAEQFARIFEPPEGAYCPGRVSTTPLPDVPTHFSFRMEVIDQIKDTVTFAKEFYDFEANYTRMDFKDPPTGNSTIDDAIDPITLINDFNTGITYAIDKITGECYTVPISAGEFDSEPMAGSNYTRIRNPKEFFDFDNTSQWPYQYMGEHMVRDIPCNSWISYRPYPNEQSSINATWEWYFAQDSVIIKAGQYAEIKEPIKLVIRVPDPYNIHTTYNFYNFREEEPDARAFDVSLCYRNHGSVSFEVVLAGNWSGYDADKHRDLLTYFFRLSLQSFSGVRPLRIQDIEMEFMDNRIATRFTLLGPAPVKGDVNNVINQVSLKNASDNLTKAFTDNTFVLYFIAEGDQSIVSFKAVPNTLRVITRREHPGSYRPPAAPLKPGSLLDGPGLSSGGAAGLAIGMIALGAFLGGVGCFLYVRMTKPKQMGYRKETMDGEN